MFERRLRLILSGVAFVTLLLPPEFPFALFVAWHCWEAFPRIFGRTDPILTHLGRSDIANRIGLLRPLPFLLAIPVILLFNVVLIGHSAGRLKGFYRILIVLSLPLIWWSAYLHDQAAPGFGWWPYLAVILGGVLLEVVLLLKERFQKSQKPNHDISSSYME
jgi:hypothetical protein